MSKRLTITVDADVFEGLKAVVGEGSISRFLNDLARRYVVGRDLDAGYAAMAVDDDREADARAWSEGLIGHVAEEPGHGR